MRILLYTFPFTPVLGGLVRLTEQTARRLAAHGLEVTVVTDTATTTPDGDRDFPFKVIRRPTLFALARAVQGADFVQLNGFDIRVFVFAFLMRRPIVWQHIDYDTVDPRGLCSRFGRSCNFALRRCWSCLRSDHSFGATLRALGSFQAKRAAARLVESNLLASAYAALRMRLPRATLLPLGVDFRAFTPCSSPIQRNGFRVLFSGRHVPYKGCDMLVEALALSRGRGLDVRAVICGDGPHRKQSQQLAERLGVADVTDFKGVVPDAELVQLARAVDAVVVPSWMDEYYCYSALEAMSSGTPVIAAETGALPEVVGNGGLLFAPGDAGQLANQIERLASDGELRQHLGRNARWRAENELSEDRMMDSYLAVYRQVIGVEG